MICIPVVAATNADAFALLARAALEPAELYELRLDLWREAPDVPALIAAATRRVIATVRSRAQGGEFDGAPEERAALLQRAIDAGAAYVDAEEDVLPLLRRTNPRVTIIASWHDFAGCPADLRAVAARLAATDADWVKFAVTPSRLSDNFAVLDAVRFIIRERKKPVIGIAMGELGLASRILGTAHGSRVTFGTLESGRESAPGQPTARELAGIYRVNDLTRGTAVYGLVGDPVAHSAGRVFHNRAYAALGVDAVYIPFLCHDLADFLDGAGGAAAAINLRGLSVTMPLKQAALGLAASASETARRAGAANTLTFADGRWTADNTDYAAVAETVRERAEAEGISLADAPALLLGAGGAGRAIGAALASLGCKVTVSARNMDKACALADTMGWEVLLPARGERQRYWRVVANSTPIGMAPDAGDTPFPGELWKSGMIAFDAVYNPRVTRFLAEAERAGAVTVDGVEMFIRQGAAQFELWTGKAMPEELRVI